MRIPVYIIGALLAISGLADACNNCPHATTYDWCTISIEQQDPEEDLLWTQASIDPQGHQGGYHCPNPIYCDICPPNWDFSFHAISTFGTVSYDPVFKFNANIDYGYDHWLKYYYTRAEEHNEPPTDPPGIYDDPPGENPNLIFQAAPITERDHRDLTHPYYTIAESINSPKTEQSITSSDISGWNGDYLLSYFQFSEIARGNPNNLLSSLTTLESWGRKYNIKSPGDYLKKPRVTANRDNPGSLEAYDSLYLVNDLIRILVSKYASSKILGYINRFEDVLNDSTRDEFYGRFSIDKVKFTLAGWPGKFTVLGIFGSYDGVEEFIALAEKYLDVRHIAPAEVSVQSDGDHYYYSLLDRDNKFALRGFELGVVNNNDESDYKIYDVIEFIKYYDEEFMP
jgi:hypothetical protein